MFPTMTPRRFVRLSALLTLTLAASCERGGGGDSIPPGSTDRFTSVVYDHDNSTNGSDLFRAPIDGSTPPANLTNHRDATRVVDTWPTRVNGRIVYVAEKDGALEFYSTSDTPPQASAAGFVQLSSIHAGTTDRSRWQVVGSRIVVRVTDNGVDNLHSFAIDRPDAKPLTDFTAPCTISWPRNPRTRSNAVTQSGIVIFEHLEAGESTVYGVVADGTSARRELSSGTLATVATDFADAPMITGDRVVVREDKPTTTQFRLSDATRDNTSKALTAELQDASVAVTDAAILDSRFVYVLHSVQGISEYDNLEVISLDHPGPDPQPTALTNFSTPGQSIAEVNAIEGDSVLAFVVEEPNADNGTDANVFSVKVDAPQSLKLLSRKTQVTSLDDAVMDLTRCGAFLVYGRQAAPNAVYQARLDQVASESELLPGQPTNFEVGVELAVYRNRVVDPLAPEVILSRPTAEIVDQVILYVRTDQNHVNYFSCIPQASGLRVDRLSNKSAEAGDVQVVKGDSIVYQRGTGLRAARIGIADSEIDIFDAAGTVSGVFADAGQAAATRVLFFVDGDLLSTRVDQAAALVRDTHQVTDIPHSGVIVDVLFNSTTRVVYTETDPNTGRTLLFSSPIAEASVERRPLSDGFSTDRFRLAF